MLLLGSQLQGADENSCNDLLNLLRSKVKSLEADKNSQLIQTCLSCMRELKKFYPAANNEVLNLVSQIHTEAKLKFEESKGKFNEKVGLLAKYFIKYSLLIN